MIIWFNSSVWHSLWVLCVPGMGAFVWVVYEAVARKQWYYFFDPKHNSDPRLADAGDFLPLWGRYEGLAKLAITLSAGAIAFLISTLANQHDAQGDFGRKVAAVAPIVVGYFGSAVLFLILFLLWLTYCYESYCHSAAHDTYRAWKYALTQCLGWMGFLAFVLGFAWIAANLFS
jgi:hypothetical protein